MPTINLDVSNNFEFKSPLGGFNFVKIKFISGSNIQITYTVLAGTEYKSLHENENYWEGSTTKFLVKAAALAQFSYELSLNN